MKQVENAVKKGEVVAVRVSRTASFVHGTRPAETTVTWQLATVKNAMRDGTVKRVIFAGMAYAVCIEPRDMFTIKGDYQAPAAQLTAAIAYPGHEWETVEGLKDAIRTAKDAMAAPSLGAKKHAFPWEV